MLKACRHERRENGGTDSPSIRFSNETSPSVLARNYPTLLTKSDPPPRPVGWCFAAGQERIFAARQMLCGLAVPPPAVDRFAGTRSFSCDLTALRAFGADDGKPPRTPSAWMISLVSPLPLRQVVFLVSVTLTEQKWAILGERRRTSPKQCSAERSVCLHKDVRRIACAGLK